MSETRTYGGLDAFKLAAALLVVAIHTSPLGSISPGGDFFLTRVLARVAVPFFFLVTGQFVLGDALFRQPPETKKSGPIAGKSCSSMDAPFCSISPWVSTPATTQT